MKWRTWVGASGAFVVGVIAGYWLATSTNDVDFARDESAAQIRSAPAQAPPAISIDVERAPPGFQRHRLAYELVASLSEAQVEPLAQSVAAGAHSHARTVVLLAMVERLADFDIERAYRFLHTHLAPGDPAFRQVFSAWYDSWLQTDGDAAIRYALALPDPTLRDAALQIAIERLGVDTPAANRLFAQLSESAQLMQITAQAGRQSSFAAFEASLREVQPERRQQLLRQAFERLLHDDARHAFAQMERIPLEERDAVVSASLARWAARQPASAWRQLDQADMPTEYRAAMLGALAELDPQQALEWLRRTDQDRPTPELHRAVVPALLNVDVSVAASAVADMREHAPVDLIQQVAAAYAARDPQQAYAWTQALELRDEHSRRQALHAVTASFVASNPDAAAAYIDRTIDPKVKDSLLREVAAFKAQRSVREGWEWLARFRTEPTYRENARALLGQWSYAKPKEVAQVVQNIGDAEFQRAAAEQLAAVWRARDRAAFQSWATSLPPGDLRDAMLRSTDADG